MKFEPRYCEENVNAPEHSHFREFIRLSLWLTGIVCGIYLVLGYAADMLAERLPPRFETAIAAGISSRIGHDDFPSTSRYLQKILESLTSSAEGLPKFPYKISVRDEKTANAIALPGGHIVIYKGLLAELKSENEVAMILAHELGHYAHHDHLHGLGRGLVLLSIMTALGMSGDIPGFIAPSLQTFNLKRSRDQESKADFFAIDTLVRAYGHAGGGIPAFKVLARESRDMKRPEFISTHPDIVWRMESLANHIKVNKYPEGSVKLLPGSGALPFPDDTKKTGRPKRETGCFIDGQKLETSLSPF